MMKPRLFCIFLFISGMAAAQPYPFNGYTLYDHLVTATHPNGCPSNYVTGLPDDSTWVNMLDWSVMTGYFEYTWSDLPGDDLLLESSFHHDNYSVRLILEGGNFSSSFVVTESMWTDLPFINWTHMFPGCIPGNAASPRLLLSLDFGLFGLGPEAVVTGIEITFLPTSGQADFSGAYIIVPPCGLFDLGQDTTICPGETVNIDATMPNATYLWQDGSTDPIYTATGAGRYYVEVTIYDCSIVDTLNVTERAGPPDLGNDTILCTGQSLELDVTTTDATYEWQDNASSPTYIVTQPGTYSVTVTIADCMYTDEIDVDFTDPPSIDLGPDMELCEGETLLLDATTPNASYEWQDQSTSSGYLVTEPGTYTVLVEVAGCTNEDEILISYIYPEPVDLGPDATLCAGETLFLDVFTTGATYVWQDNSTTSGYNVVAPGIYSVTVTTGDCSANDEIEVVYVPAFNIDLGNDTTLCNDASLTINATTPNASYLWQDQSTAATYDVISSGTYIVAVLVDACTAHDTIVVNLAALPAIDLGHDTVLCEGESLTLRAMVPDADFLWQDQTTADTFIVSASGKYWVEVTLNGCSIADTMEVLYSSPPQVDLGADTTLCTATSILLDAFSAGASYIWQDNSTEATFTVTVPGTYHITVTQQNCSAVDTVMINFTPVAPIYLGTDTTLCSGSTLTLDAGLTHASIEWQDHTTASTYLVTEAGSYWVTALEGNCTTTDTIEVDYLSLLSLTLGSDTTLCSDQTLLLDAAITGASYLWQNFSTGSTFLVDQPGTYWVEVSIGNCEVSDTIDVDFAMLAIPYLGADTTLCEGETLLLDPGTQGGSYQWQDNTNGQDYLVALPGTYALTVSIGACEVADTIQVAYHGLPVIDLGRDTTLCEGETVLLNAFSTGASYLWQDQSTQPDYLVTGPGIYFVDLHDGLCHNSDTVQVAYLSIASISLGSDTLLCADELLILEPDAPRAQYLWQDNSTNPTLTVYNPGLYWVQVNVGACLAADSILVAFSDPIIVDLGPDTTICAGGTLSLEVSIPGATLEWNDHSSLSTYLISSPGTYWVEADVMGCKAIDTLVASYIILPMNILGEDTIACEGNTILLDATVSGASYTWQDQSTDATFLVIEPGAYSVHVNLDGCVVEDTVHIAYIPPVVLDLGPDRTICDGEMLLLDPGLGDELDYLWQDQSTTGTFQVQDAGEYWLQVSDDCGIVSDTVSVTVDQCQCRLYFPNVFSPNGDLINDEVFPVATCEMAYCQLKIFDRFGDQVFESHDANARWDGTSRSRPAQSGVYAYVLVYAYHDGIQRIMTGDVTLLR